MDETQIEKLKAAHPGCKLIELTAPSGEKIIVRSPSSADWKKFRADQSDDRKKLYAADGLLRRCCVHPDAQGLDAMLELKPGLVETYGVELVELAGMAEGAEKKEL